MRSTGQIVVSGDDQKFRQYMNIYTPSKNGEAIKWKRIKSPCSHLHTYVKVLCVEAAEQEYVAVLCFKCNDIKLLDVKTGSSLPVVEEGSVIGMCHGERNRLFVQSFGGRIKELDCSTLPFTELKTITITDCALMCSVPSPRNLLIIVDDEQWKDHRSTIKAVSLDGDVVWTYEYVGDDYDHYDVLDVRNVIFVDGLGLLVAGGKGRIVVLDPDNGLVRQTINLSDVHKIGQLVALNNQIIVLHHQPLANLSFYDVIVK